MARKKPTKALSLAIIGLSSFVFCLSRITSFLAWCPASWKLVLNVFLDFWLFRREGKSGCCLARSRGLSLLYFWKPVCFLKNPRRSPTHEKNITGAEEAHIYVRTVAGSEEPMHDTYRPTVETERRRGLWWLMPRLSLEWRISVKEKIWSWNRAENPWIFARNEERCQAAS